MRVRGGYVLGADVIEMEEEFVGSIAKLPACPSTDALGWCRDPSGQAVKMAVSSPPMSTPKKIALVGVGLVALYVLSR